MFVDFDESGFYRKQQKVHVLVRPILTSANFDFCLGQFDFGQLAEVNWPPEVELVEVKHLRCLDVLLRAVTSSLLNLLDSHGGDGRTPAMRWTGSTDTLGCARELRSCLGETWFSFLL